VSPVQTKAESASAATQVLVSKVLRSLRIASLARLMFKLWPVTEHLTDNLAAHVGLHVKHPSGRPFLEEAIANGFSEMLEAQARQPEGEKFSDEVRLAYMRGLLRHLTLIFETEVRGANGEVWDALNDGPLTQWLQRHAPARVNTAADLPEYLASYQPDALAAALLNNILDRSTRRELLPILPRLTAYAD
jgi:hypothetical protein